MKYRNLNIDVTESELSISFFIELILSKVFWLFEGREQREHDMKSLDSGLVNRNVQDGAENIHIGLKVDVKIRRWKIHVRVTCHGFHFIWPNLSLDS